MYKSIIIITLFIFIIIYFKIVQKNEIKKSKKNRSFFGYKIIYSDQKNADAKSDIIYSKLLKNEKYDIKGKPDFVYQSVINGNIIPVELKSGLIEDRVSPHEGDLLQLAAYFLISEDYFKASSKEGFIIYSDYMFRIKNTRKLKRKLLKTLKNMRKMLLNGKQEPKCSFVKCRYCLCNKTVCEYCDQG